MAHKCGSTAHLYHEAAAGPAVVLPSSGPPSVSLSARSGVWWEGSDGENIHFMKGPSFCKIPSLPKSEIPKQRRLCLFLRGSVAKILGVWFKSHCSLHRKPVAETVSIAREEAFFEYYSQGDAKSFSNLSPQLAKFRG